MFFVSALLFVMASGFTTTNVKAVRADYTYVHTLKNTTLYARGQILAGLGDPNYDFSKIAIVL